MAAARLQDHQNTPLQLPDGRMNFVVRANVTISEQKNRIFMIAPFFGFGFAFLFLISFIFSAVLVYV